MRKIRGNWYKWFATIGILLIATLAGANGPQPAVGLYWYASSDPTAGGGVSAPLNQLLIRTDSLGLYYKSGTANTAWTAVAGAAAGGISGSGTAPNLMAWSGTNSAGSYAGATLKNDGNGTVCTLASDGTGNCNLAVLGAGTPGTLPTFQSAPPNNRTIGDNTAGASLQAGTGLQMNSNPIGGVTDPNVASSQNVATAHYISASSTALFTTSQNGTVVSPGSATGKFLRDDNSWQTVSGGVTSVTCGTGLTCTPNPIVGTGTIANAGVTGSGTASRIMAWSSSSVATDFVGKTSNDCGATAAARQVAIGADGALTNTCTSSFVPAATASLTVTNGAGATGTKALSTEGNVDWVFGNSVGFATTSFATQVQTSNHSKISGGELYVYGWGATRGASTTQASYGATFTTTASDDTNNAALSSATMQVIFGAQTQYGWHFKASCPLGVTRTMRIYVSVFGATITTSAKLTASLTTTSDAFTIGAVQTDKTITVTCTGGTAGDYVDVLTVVTTNPGIGSYSWAATTLAQ